MRTMRMRSLTRRSMSAELAVAGGLGQPHVERLVEEHEPGSGGGRSSASTEPPVVAQRHELITRSWAAREARPEDRGRSSAMRTS